MSPSVSTTAVPRPEALIALGEVRQQALSLSELAEEFHAKASAIEMFVASVFTGVPDLGAVEGGDELKRLFEQVKKEEVNAVDRLQTLALYEAAAAFADAVEAIVKRERGEA
jgi:hypothetical protein